MTTEYQGKRTPDGFQVYVNGKRLPFPDFGTRLSPLDFAWGHNGHGPGALSFAILAHHLGDASRALRIHRWFRREVIARLPRDEGWTLTAEFIDDLLEQRPSD